MRTDPTYPTNANTRIPVSVRTRELVKAQKRGGETYDRLLRRMVNQYDPERAER
jgi:hypothetical protein